MAAQLLKGALARVNRQGSVTECFVFSLNPEQINRRLHWPEGPNDKAPAAPTERVSFKLVLDAAVLLERPNNDPRVVDCGIRPQLAALASLMQPAKEPRPRSRPSKSNEARTVAPALVFIWGREPALPVWMVSLNVREEQFDPELNPLRASVWVELEVLMPGPNSAEPVASLSEVSVARIREMAALAWAPTSPPTQAL